MYSKRHLHREVQGYWLAYFIQKKLIRDENFLLEKAFRKIFFETRGIKEVEEFWLTYSMMATIMKDYFLEKR